MMCWDTDKQIQIHCGVLLQGTIMMHKDHWQLRSLSIEEGVQLCRR